MKLYHGISVWFIVFACSFGPVRGAMGSVLFLNHFDQSLDADHSLYGEARATSEGLSLSKEGLGYPFQGAAVLRALDAGYTSAENKNAVVRYSAVNLDSRRGTIEMWVKCNWDADLPNSRKTDLFHHFFSAPWRTKAPSISQKMFEKNNHCGYNNHTCDNPFRKDVR